MGRSGERRREQMEYAHNKFNEHSDLMFMTPISNQLASLPIEPTTTQPTH